MFSHLLFFFFTNPPELAQVKLFESETKKNNANFVEGAVSWGWVEVGGITGEKEEGSLWLVDHFGTKVQVSPIFLHLHEIVKGLYFHCSLSVCVCVCVSNVFL